MLKWGFTSFVSLLSSPSHSVLVQAASVDWAFLNLIMYPVLVVPTPATCAFLVLSAFKRAVLIRVLAVSVGKYHVNQFPSVVLVSVVRRVLIQTQ